ncbi:hypothetical protein F5Y11DRAFT_323079 [Daldinia sp. FL1419]|nr:hypothetical protein F5Y11DRAFT_323079 [Daldinia sp. FL1419]
MPAIPIKLTQRPEKIRLHLETNKTDLLSTLISVLDPETRTSLRNEQRREENTRIKSWI